MERDAIDRVTRDAILWGGLYVVATVLAFPHEVAGRVFDFGFAFAWWPPVLLLRAVRGLGPKRAARFGLLLGTLAHAGVWHWIWVVTVRYGHAPGWVGVLAPLLLALYPGALVAAFAAAGEWLSARGPQGGPVQDRRPQGGPVPGRGPQGGPVPGRRPHGGPVPGGPLGPLAVAALWTACEHARSFLLTGFPWASLGYAQHANPALLGLAAWTGVYGLGFASALGGASVVEAWLRRAPGRSGRRALVGAAALLALLALGWLGREPALPGAASLRVAVLQGNIDQGVKWSEGWLERTLAIYTDLTRRAAAEGAEVVVWPETAVPGSPDWDSEFEAQLSALAREVRATLVIGAVGVRVAGGQVAEVYDSAFLYDAAGVRHARYDKSHLVPFGEYLPFRAWLGRFIRAIATGATGRDVSPGPGPRALPLPGVSGVGLGIPICYELLFPDLMRRFTGDGAQVLLAITNDAWYGRTGAPHQFLAITALRSAESGVWTARAANTGVSALIDARGQVRERTRLFEEALLVGDVPLRDPARAPTFYVRFGDWLPYACWLASAWLLWRAWRAPAGVRP